MLATSYAVDNERKFRNAVERARRECTDLRIPLGLITKDFFKSQKSIWALKSPGQYPDLAPSTKRQRWAQGQPVYPILKRSGALEKSMTEPNDPNAIAQIINRSVLVLGTRVPYASHHQFGTFRIPERKFLFIGPEAPRFATNEMMGRPERWLNILNGFVLARLEGVGETK